MFRGLHDIHTISTESMNEQFRSKFFRYTAHISNDCRSLVGSGRHTASSENAEHHTVVDFRMNCNLFTVTRQIVTH